MTDNDGQRFLELFNITAKYVYEMPYDTIPGANVEENTVIDTLINIAVVVDPDESGGV